MFKKSMFFLTMILLVVNINVYADIYYEDYDVGSSEIGVFKGTDQAMSISIDDRTDKILSSVEIGKLSKGVVMLSVKGYDNTSWTGSGFYTSANGNIATNYHVIEGAMEIEVIEDDGDIYKGNINVLGYDKVNDLALINIDKTSDSFLELGDSDDLLLGEEIYTIGSPYGLNNTLSNGHISSIKSNLIQITAPISQGSSGGALINNHGKVIGIISSSVLEGENFGFAVPINLYTNMNKNLNYSLENFYYTVNYVAKPQNVKLKQCDDGSISIYWDNNTNADYFRVYSYNKAEKYFVKLLDDYGSDMWNWSEGTCLKYYGLDSNETVNIVVSSVKGNVESEFSDVETITLKNTVTDALPFEAMQRYLKNNYGIMSLILYLGPFNF